MIALVGGRLVDPVLGWDGPADVYLPRGGAPVVRPCGGPGPAGDWQRRDCRGLLVLPGLIDALCHLELDPDPWREDPQTLARAGVAGGYTALVAFTRSPDPRRIAALGEAGLPLRLHAVGALSQDGRLAELGLLARAGAVAYSDWPERSGSPRLVLDGLRYAASLGRAVCVRPELADLSPGGVAHESALSFALGLRGIPAVAEAAAVARDALLQTAAGGHLHFTALSAASSLEHLGQASAGVTAHHLLLDEAAVAGYDSRARLEPPLRGAEDREALLAGIRGGRLVLASGHRPCPEEEKACEYDYATPGASALETTLAVGLDLLGAEGLVRAAAVGPARALGLPGGTLGPGGLPDASVWDPEEEWIVRGQALASRGAATPLEGRRLRGRARVTVVDGRVVWDAGD